MHRFQVGQSYNPMRSVWPECAQYNYRQGAHELVLFFAAPTAAEVAAVRTGPLDVALHVDGPVIDLLYRFRPPDTPSTWSGVGGPSAIPWSDAPFTIHLVPANERTLPSATGTSEPHALVQIVLVDAASGIVHALRVASWSPAFTTAIHLAIAAQYAAPFDAQAYDRTLAALQARMSARDLAYRANARCTSAPSNVP